MSAVRRKEMELLQKRKERALVQKAAAKQGNGWVGWKSTGRRKEIAEELAMWKESVEGQVSTFDLEEIAEEQATWKKSVEPQVSTLDLGGLKPMDEVSSTKFGFICVRIFDLKRDSRFFFIPVRDLLPLPEHGWPSLVVGKTSRTPTPTTPQSSNFNIKKKPVSIGYTFVTTSPRFGRILTTGSAYRPPFVSPVLDKDISSMYSSPVFVYPNLYVMASASGEKSSDFYALDLSSGGCWKKLPSMTFRKFFPRAISVDRDIYCFGSPVLSFGGVVGPFVDVYNVDKNLWTPVKSNFILPFSSVGTLTVPLKDDDPKSSSSTGGGGIHILLHDENLGSHSCTYDIAEECFTLLPEKSLSSLVKSQPAVVDGVLYCYEFNQGQLVGYDLNSSSDRSVWTPIPVWGFSQKIFPRFMRLHLLGIGNSMLCAITTYLDTSSLMCTFFKMFKKEMNKRNPLRAVDHQPTTTVMILEAHYACTRVYAIPGYGEIRDCLFV